MSLYSCFIPRRCTQGRRAGIPKDYTPEYRNLPAPCHRLLWQALDGTLVASLWQPQKKQGYPFARASLHDSTSGGSNGYNPVPFPHVFHRKVSSRHDHRQQLRLPAPAQRPAGLAGQPGRSHPAHRPRRCTNPPARLCRRNRQKHLQGRTPAAPAASQPVRAAQ